MAKFRLTWADILVSVLARGYLYSLSSSSPAVRRVIAASAFL